MICLRKRFPARSAAFAVLAVCLLSGAGCPAANRKLSGTVTLDGKPVPGGTVYFTDRDNADVWSAVIKDNGVYYVEVVQLHTYFVTLTDKGAPSEGVIPVRYADPNTSGLSYTAGSGHDDEVFPYDIPLTP